MTLKKQKKTKKRIVTVTAPAAPTTEPTQSEKIIQQLSRSENLLKSNPLYKEYHHCVITKRKVKSCDQCLHGPSERADCDLYKKMFKTFKGGPFTV